jgi:transcriptional regulator with XRE-family HTH domain
MATANGSDYKTGFLRRTKEARERANFTQEQIARVLQIAQDRYKQYEVRSLLPHQLIGPFCAATRVTETWLLSGEVAASPKRQSISVHTG